MIRLMVGGLALALCAPAVLAETNAAGPRVLPMQFAMHREGPAEVCGKTCRTWVSAVGMITSDTPRDFAAFTDAHDVHGALIALDSGGGSVHGAIAFGRQIRRLDMTTTIGKTVETPAADASGVHYATLSPEADCESMCAFVLLAGVERVVPPQARVMIHQIWLGDRRDDAAAATYSAEDLVLVQRDIGRLAQYTAEMGGSIDFLDLSLQIPPWEPMYVLSREELRRLHVEGGAPAPAAPTVAAISTTSSDVVTSGLRREQDAPGGWSIADDSGKPALVRRHPLTLQGADIGSFDLTLTCGETPGSFGVSYRERRMAANGMAKPVQSVVLALGSWLEKLDVVSSEPAPRTLELNSLARGSVPASFVQSFSGASNKSLLVTTTSDAEHTAIRVGNSGIGASFGRLQESCDKRAPHEAHAQLAPDDRR